MAGDQTLFNKGRENGSRTLKVSGAIGGTYLFIVALAMVTDSEFGDNLDKNMLINFSKTPNVVIFGFITLYVIGVIL